MTHRLLRSRDPSGVPLLLQLTRPGKSDEVHRDRRRPGSGTEIGRIVQENMLGKINFSPARQAAQTVGAIKAENWRAWNFRIEDAHRQRKIARITKTFEGVAKTLFTTADNYMVQIQPGIPQPLLALVVASALSVDTALKQDARGLG